MTVVSKSLGMSFKKEFLWTAICALALSSLVPSAMAWAQNLGAAPATNVAVQGETAAQPEGTFLNFINWIGNVIAPVAAGRSGRRRGCRLAHRTWSGTMGGCGCRPSTGLGCYPFDRVLHHQRIGRCRLNVEGQRRSRPKLSPEGSCGQSEDVQFAPRGDTRAVCNKSQAFPKP